MEEVKGQLRSCSARRTMFYGDCGAPPTNNTNSFFFFETKSDGHAPTLEHFPGNINTAPHYPALTLAVTIHRPDSDYPGPDPIF